MDMFNIMKSFEKINSLIIVAFYFRWIDQHTFLWKSCQCIVTSGMVSTLIQQILSVRCFNEHGQHTFSVDTVSFLSQWIWSVYCLSRHGQYFVSIDMSDMLKSFGKINSWIITPIYFHQTIQYTLSQRTRSVCFLGGYGQRTISFDTVGVLAQ